MEQSLEELLQLLDSNSDKESESSPVSIKPSVEDFISDYGIEEGDELYPTYIIFYLYRQKWEGRERHSKEKKVPFFRNFNKKFESFRRRRQRYYKLNNFIEITKRLEHEAMKYDQTYQRPKKQGKSRKKT